MRRREEEHEEDEEHEARETKKMERMRRLVSKHEIKKQTRKQKSKNENAKVD